MDPEMTLQRLLDSISHNDQADTVQASADLLNWLLAGGHTPACSPKDRSRIAAQLARCADSLEVKV